MQKEKLKDKKKIQTCKFKDNFDLIKTWIELKKIIFKKITY